MAVELHVGGTLAQVTAAINALQPSNFPGQPGQLQRVQASAIAELASYPTRNMFQVDISCHHDNIMSHILIRVAPRLLNKNNEVISLMATNNDNEQ